MTHFGRYDWLSNIRINMKNHMMTFRSFDWIYENVVVRRVNMDNHVIVFKSFDWIYVN